MKRWATPWRHRLLPIIREDRSRFPDSQFNLAMALLERDQTEEALEHLQMAARLEPRDPDIQYDLGIYFSQHNSWTNAVNCFSNSVAFRPAFAPAQFALGGRWPSWAVPSKPPRISAKPCD